MVGSDVGEGVAGNRTNGDAIDGDRRNLVAACRGNGVVLVGAAVHRGCAGRGDAAAGAGRGGEGIAYGYSGQAGSDGMIGGYVGEGVAGNRTNGDAIDGDRRNLVAACRGNGVVLAGAAVHRGRAGWGDAAICTSGSGNGVSADDVGGKVRGECMVCRYVGEGITRYLSDGYAI